MTIKLDPPAQAALLFGGVVLIGCLVVWPTLSPSLPIALSPALAAALLGWAWARSPHWVWPWPAREVALMVGWALVGTAMAYAWDRVRPDGLSSLDVRALLDGTYLMPALLPAVWVGYPGTILAGLAIASLRLTMLPGGEPWLAEVVKLPLVACLAEGWLLYRGARWDWRNFALLGVLLGLGHLLAAWLFAPAAYAQGEWLNALAGSAIFGAVAGVLCVVLRDRLWPFLPDWLRPQIETVQDEWA